MDKNQVKGLVVLVLLTGLVLGGLTACGDTSANVVETQTLTGTGEGYAGEVVVEVTVEGDTITAIEVIESSDTPGLSDGAYDAIIEDVLEKQSVEGVDMVSGATGSSTGIVEAVKDALSQK